MPEEKVSGGNERSSSSNERSSSSSRGIIAAIVVILLLGVGYFFYNRYHNMKAVVSEPLSEDVTPLVEPSPSTDASPSAKPGEQMTIAILEQNKSKQAGIATITELGDKVSVRLQIAGATSSAEPAHIHLGKCPKPGEVKYPLTDVVGGISETMLDVSFSNLKSMLPLAINVHKSKEEIAKYVACGDLQ